MFTKPYPYYSKSFKIIKDRIRESGTNLGGVWRMGYIERGIEGGVHREGCIGRGVFSNQLINKILHHHQIKDVFISSMCIGAINTS